MSANTSPIFPLTPNTSWVVAVTAANTAVDGTGTVQTLYTAGANGSFCNSVIARAAGSNTASVLRLFLNNGSSTSTAANNALIGEMTLPTTTLSQVSALAHYEYPINRMLPAGYKITATLGTAVSAGYVLSGLGADY